MSDSDRIDRWLWHARLVKTRPLAQSLVTGGHVRLNRARIVKPGHAVRPGDVVTVALAGRVLVLRVEATAARRGPASEAQLLYTDLSPPAPEAAPHTPLAGERPPGAGRPTKRERRQLDAWKDVPRTPDEGEI